MTLEETVRDSLATVSGASLVSARAGRAGEVVELLRAAEGEVVLLLIDSSIQSIDRAMLIAAIGPLAIEKAPHARIGAIDVMAGAAVEDVAASARFLAAACSTTGQVLTVVAQG
ncbi:MAG: Rossmann fold domain-containing protein [Sphingomonas sp.]|jgi:hypothetical protein|uniref:Rossmann fold domain-containing protein n=1 Tax=Sphingomonas sp. TaxID=28214 RepID=UPI00356A9E63